VLLPRHHHLGLRGHALQIALPHLQAHAQVANLFGLLVRPDEAPPLAGPEEVPDGPLERQVGHEGARPEPGVRQGARHAARREPSLDRPSLVGVAVHRGARILHDFLGDGADKVRRNPANRHEGTRLGVALGLRTVHEWSTLNWSAVSNGRLAASQRLRAVRINGPEEGCFVSF